MPESTERSLRGDVAGRREPVLVLDQQPLLRFLGAHQREGALQLLAAQQEAQLALRQAFADLALGLRAIVEPGRAAFVGRIDAAVPDDHLAGAVLPGGNHAFERGIVVRMVLDLHGEPLFVTIERRTLGHGPGLEDAVAFEPEVVVQPASRNAAGRRTAAARPRPRARAGGGSGVAVKVRLAEYSVRPFFAMRDSSDGRPDQMTTSRLLAGASGYSFKEWKGTFYPENIKPEEMLAWYAERLPTVEINNTFYRMPKTAVLENWAAATPEGFRFAIKASRRITHIARIKAETAAEPLGYLYRNLAALGAKRGPVLFQLPPNLKKDLPRLAAFLRLLPGGHNAAFEFRNDTWFADDVYDALKDAGAALCLSEREDNAPPPLVETAPWGYVRLRLETYSDDDLEAVGAHARGHVVARDLRLLHARADRAGVRAKADGVRVMTTASGMTQRTREAGDDRRRRRQRVSGLLQAPAKARACYVMAHGAGAGMAHPFMASFANDLAERGHRHACAISFRTWSAARSVPIRPQLAHATVRAAVAAASRLRPRARAVRRRQVLWRPHDVASAGRRRRCPACAVSCSSDSRCIRRASLRTSARAHLFDVQIPMLFLQGTRDEFADLQLAERAGRESSARAPRSSSFDDADHSFHVPARTGRKDPQIRAEMATAVAEWMSATVEAATGT